MTETLDLYRSIIQVKSDATFFFFVIDKETNWFRQIYATEMNAGFQRRLLSPQNSSLQQWLSWLSCKMKSTMKNIRTAVAEHDNAI